MRGGQYPRFAKKSAGILNWCEQALLRHFPSSHDCAKDVRRFPWGLECRRLTNDLHQMLWFVEVPIPLDSESGTMKVAMIEASIAIRA